MADGALTRSGAAAELLARRRARASFLEYNRYISQAADDGEMPAAHHELLCEALQCVADSLPLWGEVVENLMVFMPPGSAKSTYATVRFPAWYLGRFDRRGVISASYNATLAEHFGKKVRNLVASVAHQAVFPACALSDDTRAKGEWETQNGGFYFAVGVGGGVTGRRGDIAIGDDLIRGRADADSPTIRETTWEWWKSDLRTRLKPKTARRVLIGTRWHEDDPSGRILPDDWNGQSGVFQGSDGARWHVLCLPAEARENDPLGRKPGEWLWTQWFSPTYWEAERKAQGARNWSALYQQVPVPDSGGQFERGWFQWYEPGELPKRLNLYGASDFAVTEARGDFTEHGIAGEDADGELWLVDWLSGRESSDHSLEQQLALMDQHHPLSWFGERGVIESAIGPARDKMMRERLRNRKGAVFTPIELLPVVGDKVARVASFRARARLGMVHLPRGQEWATRLVDQLCAFPAGTHDDMVDVCGLLGRGLDQMYSAPRELTPEQRGVKPFTVKWLTSGDKPSTPAKRL